MQEYAVKFAEWLEQIAIKIRSLTVDRIRRAIKLTGMGILVATLVFTAVVFLVWALFESLEIPLTTGGAFAVFGAIAVAAGAYMWFKRSK